MATAFARAVSMALVGVAGCTPSLGESDERAEEAPAVVASPIVGGKSSTAHAAVGMFNVANDHLCSGVLIAPDVVLTAGHCFANFYRAELLERPKVWFFAGFVGPRGTVYRASRVVVRSGSECRFTKTGRDLA